MYLQNTEADTSFGDEPKMTNNQQYGNNHTKKLNPLQILLSFCTCLVVISIIISIFIRSDFTIILGIALMINTIALKMISTGDKNE